MVFTALAITAALLAVICARSSRFEDFMAPTPRNREHPTGQTIACAAAASLEGSAPCPSRGALSQDRVWFTDALPYFHVHRGRDTPEEAMSRRYDMLARTYGLPLHQLLERQQIDQLIRRAVLEEGPRLVDEMLTSGAPLLMTLGNEALAVAGRLPSS